MVKKFLNSPKTILGLLAFMILFPIGSLIYSLVNFSIKSANFKKECIQQSLFIGPESECEQLLAIARYSGFGIPNVDSTSFKAHWEGRKAEALAILEKQPLNSFQGLHEQYIPEHIKRKRILMLHSFNPVTPLRTPPLKPRPRQ